jgi:hypothetical protein
LITFSSVSSTPCAAVILVPALGSRADNLISLADHLGTMEPERMAFKASFRLAGNVVGTYINRINSSACIWALLNI